MVEPGSVLSLGEVLMDFIVADSAPSLEEATSFIARPGGAPANVAVALARLGVPSAFCGAVGADPFGNRLRRVLDEAGVETASLQTIEGESTTLAFAWKDELGDGHFQIVRLADTKLSVEQVESAAIDDQCAAIIVGSVALTDEPSRGAIYRAVELAHDAGTPVVFDVNVRPTLWPSSERVRTVCTPILEAATILKLSIDDAACLFDLRDPAEIFAVDLGSSILLLTDGGRGAWFRDVDGAVQHVPAFEIEPVEPTGAGDAFTAAIVSRYLRSRTAPTGDDVRFAAAAGAITATRLGAIESLPTREEIEQFLATR